MSFVAASSSRRVAPAAKPGAAGRSFRSLSSDLGGIEAEAEGWRFEEIEARSEARLLRGQLRGVEASAGETQACDLRLRADLNLAKSREAEVSQGLEQAKSEQDRKEARGAARLGGPLGGPVWMGSNNDEGVRAELLVG